MSRTRELSRKRHGRRTWILFALSLLTVGCATSGDQPAERQSPPWTEMWRPRANTTTPFGVDPRAREIERNLSVY